MKTCLLLLPNTLFTNIKHNEIDKIDFILFEHPKFFIKYKYHKLKLVFHRSTMKAYYNDYLEKKYNNVKYINFNQALKLDKYDKIIMYDPVDFEILQDIHDYCKKNNKILTLLDTNLFILTNQDMKDYIKDVNKPYLNSTFYKWVRVKKNILMNKDKPVGGKWSFDTENRKPFPSDHKESPLKIKSNEYTIEAQKYIDKYFSDNHGEYEIYYPTTHQDAKKWLNTFLKNRLENFGEFEDAISSNPNHVFSYHSCISALLNIGLLNPNDVIKKALTYKKNVPISSLEGFIRQIISWREYVRMLYVYEHKTFNKLNVLNHNNKLNKIWYTGQTGIVPVDNVIKKVLKYSYCHHIERLMILGNFMLLMMISPKEIYKWFIELVSIDAYEWVMEPNIYGMSQHSVGTLMMTRPYFSSSNYIFKMSDYKKSDDYDKIKLKNKYYEWYEVWDALYYNFLNEHKKYLKKIYSTAFMVKILENKSTSEKNKLFDIAREYLKKY